MDGFAVIERLHRDATLRLIPCVAVTALAMIGDKSVIMRAGFDGYITKPIDPEKFVAEIESYLKAKSIQME